MNAWGPFAEQSNADIIAWAAVQDWARAMSDCGQDARWHAEGDVWTHTHMVCAQLEQLAEWPDLPRDDQLTLLFTALFHDAGKPATTIVDPDTGRTRSPHHAAAGAKIARRVLRESGVTPSRRDAVCSLVICHGRPPYAFEKERPELEVVRTSWFVNNRLLYLYALADTRGRDTIETTRPEDNLHLWKLLAEEHDCYSRPYPFANDHARFLFYRGELDNLHYAPHEDYRCTMTVMSGLPGAGKDTWLAQHAAGQPVVSLDEIRDDFDIGATDNQGPVVQAARERCREHLRRREHFALNATNISRQLRHRWIDLGHDYQARIRVVYVESSLDVLLAQNKTRPKPVPESVILRLLDIVDPPNATECHDLVYVDP